MDLQLLKTFLEVAATGSFGAAAGRLFVTQSAVSLRVQRLEDELGRALFERGNGGVALTAAGREFRSSAAMILTNWEQARQRVSALDDMPASMVIGAQGSLWPRFGFGWLDRLRAALPQVQIRAEMGRNEALNETLLSGAAQAMLCFEPMNRPGLVNERLMEDRLVMVSSCPDATIESVGDSYVMVDWGPEFCRFHHEALPQLSEPRLVLALGAVSAWYLASRSLAAYLPERYLRAPLGQMDSDEAAQSGALLRGEPRELAQFGPRQLYPVQGAPSFTQTAWVVWREDMAQQLRNVAAKTLFDTVKCSEKAAFNQFEMH
ncbi:LysR family transcriptional regulator [Xinfangfangia sp. CPCC 101601]|uniref:LysR family transcriptional regulator n=1 Tax=Pseudogemmobacter lacusdianii TaxID=3069608 RepID=A0ABU0VVN2_9RHOB|nr:LysR family transcriptional regulator [Xinfangfangia sp. CPCC 101601]MDQ2065812.1 LysR family transcriptional regulator [Xinfangfangia sp. CPCC 101601]